MPLFKDPYPNVPNESRVRVQAEIDPDDYKYLFRKVLGVRGCQEPIIGTLLKALIVELKKPQYGIPDNYDDDNFGKIQSIINRVNFNPIRDHGKTGGTISQVSQTPSQPPMARRADNRTARSTSPPNERGRKTKAHSSDTNVKNVTTNTKGKVTGGK